MSSWLNSIMLQPRLNMYYLRVSVCRCMVARCDIYLSLLYRGFIQLGESVLDGLWEYHLGPNDLDIQTVIERRALNFLSDCQIK
jgi:hypothetical protein